MSKRRKFILVSLVLSLGFVIIQLVPNLNRFISIPLLSLATGALFFWGLKEGLGKNATLLTLLLPMLYTIGVGFFWFLLPATTIARLPAIIVYGVGIYALCLTSNIFTVAAIRTIALARAARGVGFVLTLFTTFLIFDTLISFRAQFWLTSLAIAISSFPLFLQGLWSVEVDKKLSREVLLLTLVMSLALGEIAMLLSFWPVTVSVGSLFLTVAMYLMLGLGQAKLELRLFPQTTREYLVIGVTVFVGMFLATHWGG